jgi:uncharacterized membrane protein YhaH (DUF805 family)
MKYYIKAFINVLDFKGKANIKEFWCFLLLNIFITILLSLIGIKIFNSSLISDIYRYISLIPLLSLGFRRLRDAGFSPWLFLIPFINLILAGISKKE